jgi:hypothetical protein
MAEYVGAYACGSQVVTMVMPAPVVEPGTRDANQLAWQPSTAADPIEAVLGDLVGECLLALEADLFSPSPPELPAPAQIERPASSGSERSVASSHTTTASSQTSEESEGVRALAF